MDFNLLVEVIMMSLLLIFVIVITILMKVTQTYNINSCINIYRSKHRLGHNRYNIYMKNDDNNSIKTKITSILPSSFSFITSKAKKIISNVLPALLIVFLLPLQSHAVYRTGKKSILASKSSSSVSTQEVDKKTKTGSDKRNNKIDVEVIITDDDYNDESSKQVDYQKYGLIMAAATVIISLLAPTDNAANKKKYIKPSKDTKPRINKALKNRKSSIEEDDDDEDDDDEIVPNSSFRSRMNDPIVPATKRISPNIKKLMSSSDLLKPPDDILDDFEDLDIDVTIKKKAKNVINDENEDDDDDLFANDDVIASKKSIKRGKNDDIEPKVPSSVTRKFNKIVKPQKAADDDEDDDEDLFSSDKKSVSISSKGGKVELDDDIDAEQVAPPPPPPPAKKNIFQKIFSKPGAGRISDINQVLRIDDAAQDMRLLIANNLKSYVNADLFDFDESPYDKDDANDDDSRASLVSNSMSDFGLSEQETANAFADVASAMLVKITDKASELYDFNKDDIDELLLALDDVAEFVRGAGSMFSKTTPGAIIEPVLYNGKVKSGKLENLYLEYMKSTMNIGSIMGLLGGDAEQSEGKDQEEQMKQIEYRSEALVRLQQVFSIKEGKRNSLEQKISRDMLMNMAKGGGGGLGNIGEMMSALTGKGGAGADVDMEALMKSFGGGKGDGDLPDMSNMSPEEIEQFSSEATASVKEALKTGSFSKDDLLEFERMMGFDIKKLTSMLENGQIDKNKMKEMGGEDLIEIFKELGKLK